MYELHQVTESCYYIQSPAKIGLIKLDGNDVCLIDSGNDKETGRKIRQILDENGWRLRAIYNTHSNADHIGGNKYRLVVEMQYRAGIAWVKFVGTHAQYDRIDVENVNEY